MLVTREEISEGRHAARVRQKKAPAKQPAPTAQPAIALQSDDSFPQPAELTQCRPDRRSKEEDAFIRPAITYNQARIDATNEG
jgi:hypothetical protein